MQRIYVTQERTVNLETHEPEGRWHTEPIDVNRLHDYTMARAFERAESTNHRSFTREARMVTFEVGPIEVVDAYQPEVVAGGDINWGQQS